MYGALYHYEIKTTFHIKCKVKVKVNIGSEGQYVTVNERESFALQ